MENESELREVPLLHTHDLGLVPYLDALALQRRAAELRIKGELPHDVLLLCEHPPVITLGRGFKPPHLLTEASALPAAGVELHDVERGGDITVHEPGQLVGYLVLDLKRHKKDLHWFLRQVEQGIIDGVAPFGVQAARRAGLTGVWADERKLASIGVHARDWVTWHGFALNVSNSLATFAHTVPCGIPGVEMTSVYAECDRLNATRPAQADVVRAVSAGIASAFSLHVAPLPHDQRALLHTLTAE